MNILFMSLLDFDGLSEHNIYTDLLRQFVINGHEVAVISPFEKRRNNKEGLIKEQNSVIVKIRIGNIQKVNFVEKGISTIMLENQMIRGIKKYLNRTKFDLILYTTPPITFQKAISYVKKRDKAVTYLLLKDIFPQNAVDLGVLHTRGIKGIVYRFFRNKEKKLYEVSDYIGCMSEANVRYLLKNNLKLSRDKVEVCPNSMEPIKRCITEEIRNSIRNKYGIPTNKMVFIYGGNLGKPQGVDFLLKCVSVCSNPMVHFVIVGGGTEYSKVEAYAKHEKKGNITVIGSLPREEYEQLSGSSDIGLILLDRRFTIPNFPSRLLSYMQASIPVLAATDKNTDVGEVICTGKFGYWSEHGDVEAFLNNVDKICTSREYFLMCHNSQEYFMKHYTAEHSYQVIVGHFHICGSDFG